MSNQILNGNEGLGGVIPAVPTPVSDEGRPNTGLLIEFCKKLLGRGASAVNILGTTGEATSFSLDDRMNVIRAVAESDIPKERAMFGTGAASVADAETLTRAVSENGFAAALVLPPFYFKDPSIDGLLRYFDKVVEATRPSTTSVFLYNFPALSGVPYTLDLIDILKRAFGDQISGLKDSSGDLEYASNVAASFPSIRVFPSNEGTLPECRSGRYAGCISATANLTIDQCAAALHDGDARALCTAKKIRSVIATGPLVPRIKSCLAVQTGDSRWSNVLPPYAPLAALEAQALANLVDDLRADGS